MHIPKVIFAGVAISEDAIEPGHPLNPVDAYQLFVDGATEYAAFTLSPAGVVASWNRGAERIKGYRSEDIIGQHFSVFYLPEERHAGLPEQLLVAAMQDGTASMEGWRVRRDGSCFWAQVAVMALWDRTGALRGFAKLTRDETRRREADEAREAAARRAEQERIAAGLGETLVHDLFQVGLELAAAQRLAGDAELSRRVAAAREHADDAIRSLRQTMFDSVGNGQVPVRTDVAGEWVKVGNG